nr:methyltransferase domain-containing protein [Litoribrevibacter albus]
MSNKKRSKSPGDNIEMVLARQTFLNTGIYQPISEALNETCSQWITEHASTLEDPIRILDLGCGEGYYTERLYNALHPQSIELIGLDISKDAVRYAAKRNKQVTWLVASGAEIPVMPRSQDLIVCLFTRLMPEGIAPALSRQGTLITVTTGKQHLIEMREILYPSIKDQVLDPQVPLASHFKLDQQQAFQAKHTLTSSQQIQDLLAMTPHQWRAPAVGREKLLSLDSLTITIDVNISCFSLKEDQISPESL